MEKMAVRSLGATLHQRQLFASEVPWTDCQPSSLTLKPVCTDHMAHILRQLRRVVRELIDVAEVFNFTSGHNHTSVPSMSYDFYVSLNETKLLDWVKTQLILLNYVILVHCDYDIAI